MSRSILLCGMLAALLALAVSLILYGLGWRS